MGEPLKESTILSLEPNGYRKTTVIDCLIGITLTTGGDGNVQVHQYKFSFMNLKECI